MLQTPPTPRSLLGAGTDPGDRLGWRVLQLRQSMQMFGLFIYPFLGLRQNELAETPLSHLGEA